MASTLLVVSIDCTAPGRLAGFWSQALGYKARRELPSGTQLIAEDEQATPWLAFISVPEAKRTKNRLHLDLSPDDQEGNEFCVLPPRRP